MISEGRLTEEARCKHWQGYDGTIIGLRIKRMDVHWITNTDESLTRAMNRYTKWLDGHLGVQNGDHHGAQVALKKLRAS